MLINNLIKGFYISRPNRFTVKFKNNDKQVEIAHLHDPGRLKELLIENTEILIKYIPTYKKTGRKTKYDVIGVKNGNNWILLNSKYHNKLVKELIDNKEIPGLEAYHVFKPEYTYNNSRLDFLLKNNEEKELYLEVKGCTLVIGNIAKFPDAPTKRGTKHVHELTNIRLKNNESAIIILVLHNDATRFMPNYETDPEFGEALKKAYDNHVNIIPLHILTEFYDNTLSLKIDKVLPIIFK